jgi:4a-hydroxytetrahydrobiopterin dehydratase
MTEPLTMRAFHADDRTRDWRVVGDGAIAVFRTGSFAAGARLVQAIAAAVGDAGQHHPDVDLQHDAVTVRLLTATPDYMGMTAGDVELAVRISDLAREQGLAADPALIQTVQVTIDALVSADVMPFWAAVLGYERRAGSPDQDLIDPRWRSPSIWFQHMDAPRPQRNRFHIDVWVPPELARRAWPRPSRPAGGWSAMRRPRGGPSPTPRATRSTSPRRPGATDPGRSADCDW